MKDADGQKVQNSIIVAGDDNTQRLEEEKLKAKVQSEELRLEEEQRKADNAKSEAEKKALLD